MIVFWVCVGSALEMTRVCVGDVLGMWVGDVLDVRWGICWGCVGCVLVMFWLCFGSALGVIGVCVGYVLAMSSGCLGDVLDACW